MASNNQTTATFTLLSKATGTGTGKGASLPQAYSVFTVQVNYTGSPTTVTLQMQGSLDGQNWVNWGNAFTPTTPVWLQSVSVGQEAINYIRANLTVLSGGSSPTVTVLCLGNTT